MLDRTADAETSAAGAVENQNESQSAGIVEATAHFEDPEHVAKVSRGLGEAMRGLEASAYGEHLADRGW